MKSIEGKVLKKHIEECIKESFEDKGNPQNKIDEIVALLKR